MSHDHHESLEGFHDSQILVDGCAECAERSATPSMAISHMDNNRFSQAWRRAFDLNALRGAGVPLDERSAAEMPVLNVLWAVMLQLERRGIPVNGSPPGSLLDALAVRVAKDILGDRVAVGVAIATGACRVAADQGLTVDQQIVIGDAVSQVVAGLEL